MGEISLKNLTKGQVLDLDRKILVEQKVCEIVIKCGFGAEIESPGFEMSDRRSSKLFITIDELRGGSEESKPLIDTYTIGHIYMTNLIQDNLERRILIDLYGDIKSPKLELLCTVLEDQFAAKVEMRNIGGGPVLVEKLSGILKPESR